MNSQPRTAYNSPALPSRWPHRFAIATATATMPLILMGGLVTNTGSALAVPDWPTSFGYNMFTYPPAQWVGGIFYEHSHRLLGSLVGFLTVLFALVTWRCETRRWVRRLALLALVGVIIQGVLGGLRVVLLQHGLAIVHGCVAQAFFGLMVSLCVVTSTIWERLEKQTLRSPEPRLRTMIVLVPALVYLQMIAGALLTHIGAMLAVHLTGAALITLTVGMSAGWIWRDHSHSMDLYHPTLLLVTLLAVQLALGMGAFLWHYTDLPEHAPFEFGLLILASHRITGTAIWATALVLSLRLARAMSSPLPANDWLSRPAWKGHARA